MAGFIKIYRSIFEHWIFNDAEKFKAFIDLIQLARWKDEKLLIGNKLVTIPRGSFYTSELKLAERWGWSRHKTRDFLNLLEKEKMITKKGTSKGTTITIENYSFYQDEGTTEDTTKGQQKDNKRTARGHQKDIIGYTKEERKKDKESKEGEERKRKQNETQLSPLSFPTDVHKEIFDLIGEIGYRTWFMDSNILLKGEVIEITVIDALRKNVIENNYSEKINTCLHKKVIVKVGDRKDE